METIVATKFLTFNAKCQIIRHLLIKKRHVSKKQAEKAYDNLTKEVARLRNIIAHSSLDTSGSAIDLFKRDKTITFTKYDKGKNSEKITKAKHIKISEIIQAAKGYFFMKNYAKRNKPKP